MVDFKTRQLIYLSGVCHPLSKPWDTPTFAWIFVGNFLHFEYLQRTTHNCVAESADVRPLTQYSQGHAINVSKADTPLPPQSW